MSRSSTPSKGRRRYQRLLGARQRMQQKPGIIEAFRTFAPVYDLLRDLRSGYADAVQGRVVLRDWEHEYCEAATALDGWVSCWQRIIAGENLAIDIAAVSQLQRYLGSGVLLTSEIIERAHVATDACYSAYLKIPRERLRQYSQTELIAIELDALGLRDPSPQTLEAA